MLYDLVEKKLKEFDDLRYGINSNLKLSDVGKKSEMQKVNMAFIEYEPKAYAILRDDMANLRKAFKANEAARAAAVEDEASRWDFNRLNYASQAVQQAVTRIVRSNNPLMGDVPEQMARLEWDRARHANEKHVLRAWIEFGSEALEAAFPDNKEMHILAGEMRRSLHDLLTTPEIQAVDRRGEELANTAIALVAAINKADAAYTPPEPAFGPLSKYQDLLQGVTVNKKYLGEAGFVITVYIDDYPTESLADTFSKAGLS